MAKQFVYDGTLKKEIEIEVDDQESDNFEQSIIDGRKVERNALLLNSDWTMVADNQLTDEQKLEASTYRQALRDLPNQEGFPDVEFPAKPDFI
tara:strand:+ start:1811 stop:2089 length:279 start_codon:yes stop_codon:yes gene_type:complete